MRIVAPMLENTTVKSACGDFVGVYPNAEIQNLYGQFSKCHVCFCGLDPGNLKFETVRIYKQHICFKDLRRSI